MRLAFRCVVAQRHPPLPVRRAGERPGSAAARRAHGAGGGRRGDRRRADVLDQPRAHARVLRRARRGARRLRRHRPLLPQGSRRAADDRTRCASWRRTSSRRGRHRSSCTATARSGSRRSSTWKGSSAGFHVLHTAVGPAGSGTSQPTVESTLRNLEAEGYAHRLDLDGARARWRSTSASSCARSACRRARRSEYDAAYYHHQLPGGMVTTTHADARGDPAGPSCSTRCSRRSCACAPRWAIRSSSRPSRSSSRRRRRAT